MIDLYNLVAIKNKIISYYITLLYHSLSLFFPFTVQHDASTHKAVFFAKVSGDAAYT